MAPDGLDRVEGPMSRRLSCKDSKWGLAVGQETSFPQCGHLECPRGVMLTRKGPKQKLQCLL